MYIWLFQVIFTSEYEKNLSSIRGFSTIVQALVKSSKYTNILSNKKETQALIQQWLEYIVICINYADIPINAKRILNVSIIYIYIKYVFLT